MISLQSPKGKPLPGKSPTSGLFFRLLGNKDNWHNRGRVFLMIQSTDMSEIISIYVLQMIHLVGNIFMLHNNKQLMKIVTGFPSSGSPVITF